MEFYRLNYSLAIFNPEVNLKGKTENRNALAEKAGCGSLASQDKPILIQILEALQNGGGKSKQVEKAPEPAIKKAPEPSITALKNGNLIAPVTKKENKDYPLSQPHSSTTD